MDKSYPFTVKHVLGVKQEYVYPAMRTRITNNCLVIWESDNDYVVREITGGHAYVVNQNGKTVASYELEG